MTDMIEKLYDAILEERETQGKEYAAYKDLSKAEEKLWDKVRPLVDCKVIEDLQNTQDSLLIRSNLEWFRRGIRTGMSLMLELL